MEWGGSSRDSPIIWRLHWKGGDETYQQPHNVLISWRHLKTSYPGAPIGDLYFFRRRRILKQKFWMLCAAEDCVRSQFSRRAVGAANRFSRRSTRGGLFRRTCTFNCTRASLQRWRQPIWSPTSTPLADGKVCEVDVIEYMEGGIKVWNSKNERLLDMVYYLDSRYRINFPSNEKAQEYTILLKLESSVFQ